MAIERKLGGKDNGDHAQKATLKEAYVTDERYVRASWVNFFAMIFHELTAINIVMAFSTTILDDILGDPDEQTSSGGFTARQGTYVIGLVNFLSACLCILSLRFFGRRTLLLIGHTGICLSYLFMAVFTITGADYGVLVMLCTFLLIYQNTSGPVAWAYAAETCCDVSLGVSLLVLYSVVLFLSLTTSSLMDSALQP